MRIIELAFELFIDFFLVFNGKSEAQACKITSVNYKTYWIGSRKVILGNPSNFPVSLQEPVWKPKVDAVLT